MSRTAGRVGAHRRSRNRQNGGMSDGKCQDGDVYLTTQEAAAFLKVSEQVLRRFVRTGEIPAVQVGRDWRYLRSELIALGRRKQGPPPTG